MVVLLFLSPDLAFADNTEVYRLVRGDVLRIAHPAAETTSSQAVDLDGNLRLTGIGPILVTGLTLDETASAIRKEIEDAELYVDPQVTVSLTGHAPVLVAGDVNQPGEIGYVPGLTIAAALALSGGRKSETPIERERARSRANLTGQIDRMDFAITSESEKLRALKLALNNAGDWSPTWQKSEDWSTLNVDNRAWFAADQERLAVFLDAWSAEAEAVKSQMALLGRRIEVQRAKVDIAKREIVDAEALKAKGLQTSVRLAGLRRQEADTRSDLLELESALVMASIALIQVQARRDRHLAERKATLLEEIHTTRQGILNSKMERETLVAQLHSLGPTQGDWQLSKNNPLAFTILSLRAYRASQTSPGPETFLFPGDTLIVRTGGQDNTHGG